MARDTYHALIRRLLEEDGWTITHDPLYVKTGLGIVEVDLGAERLIGAEKAGRKIAIEIKSFIGHSKLHDLYKALGQYVFYQPALHRQEPDRQLFLAVPKSAYEFFFQDPIAEDLTKTHQLRFIVFNPLTRSLSWTE